MTNARIEYHAAALGKMDRRGFSRNDVRTLLATGDRVEMPSRDQRKYGKVGTIRGEQAMVVYLENAERVLVISVQWLSKNEKDWHPHPKGRSQ